MAQRRGYRADFPLGFRNYVADAFDRAGIKLLGLTVGDQSPFNDALGYGAGDRATREDREPWAEPNRNSDSRYGPIWQTVHGVVPVTLTGASFPTTWLVDR
jgi:hypothetical protein